MSFLIRIRKIKSKIKEIDSNSIRGQLLINLIDKVVIGGIVGIIALCITNKLQEKQKIRDIKLQEEQTFKELRFSVIRVHTNILQEQRDKLIDQMANYIRIVKSLRVETEGKIHAEKDRNDISEITNDIIAILFNIGNISNDENSSEKSQVQIKGESFTKKIRDLNSQLIVSRTDEKEIIKKVDNISKEYKELVREINSVISEVLIKEFKNSRQLGEGR